MILPGSESILVEILFSFLLGAVLALLHSAALVILECALLKLKGGVYDAIFFGISSPKEFIGRLNERRLNSLQRESINFIYILLAGVVYAVFNYYFLDGAFRVIPIFVTALSCLAFHLTLAKIFFKLLSRLFSFLLWLLLLPISAAKSFIFMPIYKKTRKKRAE